MENLLEKKSLFNIGLSSDFNFNLNPVDSPLKSSERIIQMIGSLCRDEILPLAYNGRKIKIASALDTEARNIASVIKEIIGGKVEIKNFSYLGESKEIFKEFKLKNMFFAINNENPILIIVSRNSSVIENGAWFGYAEYLPFNEVPTFKTLFSV